MPTSGSPSVAYACQGACTKADDVSVHHEQFPSGVDLDVRLPSLGQLVLYDAVLNPFEALVQKLEYGEFKPAEASRQEQDEFHRLISTIAALTVVPELPFGFVHGYEEVTRNGEPHWQRVTPSMPKEDRDHAWGLAMRTVPIGGAQKAMLDALRRFRDEQGGGAVAPDVQAPPNRSGHRAAARAASKG